MQSCMLWAQAGEKVARAEPLSIWEGFRATFEPLAELLPRLGVALLILIVGYLISQLLGRLATMLSDRLGLQAAARRSGLAESMQRAGMASSLPALVGSLVFWLLMGCWLLVAFGVMGG